MNWKSPISHDTVATEVLDLKAKCTRIRGITYLCLGFWILNDHLKQVQCNGIQVKKKGTCLRGYLGSIVALFMVKIICGVISLQALHRHTGAQKYPVEMTKILVVILDVSPMCTELSQGG